MERYKGLASELKISEEKLIAKLDTFFTYAQVQLANLEDAIAAKKYEKIVRFAHKIGKEAAKLNLSEVFVHTEHIEILATFKRDTDYMQLFEELQQTLLELHETFVEARTLLAAR